MANRERVLLVDGRDGAACAVLCQHFDVVKAAAPELSAALLDDVRIVVIGGGAPAREGGIAGICAQVQLIPALADLPVLALIAGSELQDKLAALEAGCDDVIDSDIPLAEIVFRAQKSVLHKRASAQLKSMAQQASQVAFSAMADTSNLGVNIRFLLDSARCDTLDQLGMLFFEAVKNYGLSCSLQMRSDFAVKNMEATGLQKELESQLLTQLCKAGRYYDFGTRTVCNYGRASVLIRNMPVHDEVRYGSIKDNTFTLMQGLDARIAAIDNTVRLQQEQECMRHMSMQTRHVMTDIEDRYQSVMRRIADIVDDMAEHVDAMIPRLALSLEQEQFLEKLAHDCVLKTSLVFNEGLKVDESFRQLLQGIDSVLAGDTTC